MERTQKKKKKKKKKKYAKTITFVTLSHFNTVDNLFLIHERPKFIG
jgi:hypothetical protein